MNPKFLPTSDLEIFNITGSAIFIPKCSLIFPSHTGKPIKETFGGKPIIYADGKPMFAELAIMTYFQKSGWQARWTETYGKGKDSPIFLSSWKDDKFKNQIPDPIEDKNIIKILSEIANLNNHSYSGCWDVIGWKGDKIIFAESKRFKKDKIRQTQINWLSAGLKYGLKPENFLVVQWEIKN